MGGMRYIAPTLCLILAACNAPSMGYRGLPAYTAQVGGADFTIRADRDKAEAVRTNTMMGARFGTIAPLAAEAMTQVTGCAVVPGSLGGDVAVITARLDCP